MDLPEHLMQSSFSPPTYAPGLEVPGSWVLLDNEAYFSDHENATTAECHTSHDDGQRIKVTFCLAKPPLVSHFCIQCPGLDPYKFGMEPRIIATEDQFALLRVPICHRSCRSSHKHNDFFIYQASTRTSLCRPFQNQKPLPSLLLLPNPLEFADNAIGILPRHTDKGVTFVLAALEPQRQTGVYELHLFSAVVGADHNWTSRVVSCHPPLPELCSFLFIQKVITIDTERGLMGWVDLWRGILICDVLSKNPVLRYVPLPTPAVRRVTGLGSSDIFRDMVAVRGTVRYFEMKLKVFQFQGTWRAQGWIATTWRSTRTGHSWKWHEECTFDVFDVVVDGNSHVELQASPKQGDDDTTMPIFSLFASSPALSLDDDHLVYFMAKMDISDDNAWIISVDMKNQSLQGVAEFSADRTLGARFTYLRSTISKFICT